MAYTCIDCSYKGNKFVNGACPACGSANVRGEILGAGEEKEKKPYRLIVAIVLWLVFVVELYRKLSA